MSTTVQQSAGTGLLSLVMHELGAVVTCTGAALALSDRACVQLTVVASMAAEVPGAATEQLRENVAHVPAISGTVSMARLNNH